MSGRKMAAIVGDGTRCIVYRRRTGGKRLVFLGDHPGTLTAGWTLQWLERNWARSRTPGVAMVPYRIDAVLTSPDGDKYAYTHHQPMYSGSQTSPDLGYIQPLDAALAEAGIASLKELVRWEDLFSKKP